MWYARVLLLFSASVKTDTGSKSSDRALVSTLETLERLAAAGRLRSAVALELVVGKVWALLDAVQPLVGSTAVTARVHPAWVRRHGLAR